MTINEGHNATPISIWAQLRRLMDEHPDAKIVTWIGETDETEIKRNWSDLCSIIYDEKLNQIELVFEE